jgi:S1-C subfamily serine protease
VQIFTGPHADYHRPTDDVSKVDADGLVKVATFVRETLVYLGDRDGPLSGSVGPGAAKPPAGGARRVSLGTMPDFAFRGPGVKVGSVLDGSPAAKAGVETGDILLAIDDEELADLRTFSQVLKQHKPGDVISIKVRRGEEDLTLEAKLVAR